MLSAQKLSIAAFFAVIGAYALFMPLHAIARTPEPVVSAALRQAIREHVEGEGAVYAGLCDEIDQATHADKSCAFVTYPAQGRVLVSHGPLASGSMQHELFVLGESGWQVRPAPSVRPAPPPDDADAEEGEPNEYEPLIFALLAGTVLVSGAGAMEFAHRRL